jgi:hypothetical protein
MSTARVAVALARRGWRVFPCSGKLPLTEHGCKDATEDTDKVREWWTRFPSANVAIATGRGLLVVDIDGEQGRASLELLEQRHAPLPRTLTAKTGGGGLHLYFHLVTQLGNTAGKLGPGIDTRGDGGYVIAPPSIHSSGQRYEWDQNEEMAAAPPWLIRLLSPPPRREPHARPISDIHMRSPTLAPAPVDGVCSAYGQAALEREAEAVAKAADGQRNHSLNRAAFSLGQLVAGGELDEHLVRDRLAEAALACGLPEREVAATLESGLPAGMKLPRRAR